eukprot:TRINITY_DN8408_c0_g1_i1.p1 TRINITY_DN8408_c0_g1~~TRINITY_DN8408_c0_g1_i1.p1  ORF type:complete len:361 (-),score=44.22 TRINITY_DN8408_c0_g1_i1:75-1109(-)
MSSNETNKDNKKKWVRNNNAKWPTDKSRTRLLWIPKQDILPLEYYSAGKQREGPIPVHPTWRVPTWIVLHSFPALFIQMLSYYLMPTLKWNVLFYGIFIFVYHAEYLVRLIRNLHYWINYYGVLDYANCGRDLPRDNEVFRLATDILIYDLVRTLGVIYMGGYDPNAPPTFGLIDGAVTLRTIIKMVVWFLTLDFFFYVYHRACHQVPFLWKIHYKHHMTKHPTPLQAILAGNMQELLEVAIIPFLATYFIPMNSYELWILMCTLVYVEALGHTGVRAYWGHPILNPILDPIGLALIVEDHDLHHRNGKSGLCFGKQSLIWDRLFNTVGERIECTTEKIAFKTK